MAQYRISKTYDIDLVIEASSATAALALAQDVKVDIQVTAGSKHVLAANPRYTGEMTTHKAAVTQEQVAARAKAKAEEAEKAKAKVAARRTKEGEIRVLLAGRNA